MTQGNSQSETQKASEQKSEKQYDKGERKRVAENEIQRIAPEDIGLFTNQGESVISGGEGKLVLENSAGDEQLRVDHEDIQTFDLENGTTENTTLYLNDGGGNVRIGGGAIVVDEDSSAEVYINRDVVVGGSIRVSSNNGSVVSGEIRYSFGEFQGYDGGDWVPFYAKPKIQATQVTQVSADLSGTTNIPVGSSFSFFKDNSYTNLELSFGGVASVFSMTDFGVIFEIRANNLTADFIVEDVIYEDELRDRITLRSIYDNLPAGTYTIQIYARMGSPGTSATNVTVNPGNWPIKVLVKEY